MQNSPSGAICPIASGRAQNDQRLNETGTPPMRYHVAPLFCRPWTLNGISPRLMESHYEHDYGGAVARLNAITNELAALDPASTAPDVISRLKRDELAALNST